jgi:uncharacterized paraquat-inducible protein A
MTKRRLNVCEDCKYTWYPRGKDLSPKCPQCGSTKTKIKPPNTLAIVLVLIIIIVLARSFCIANKDADRQVTTTQQPTAVMTEIFPGK